jgi:5,5'-dehydrodivanillate O-demethylase oxygenase subunit
MPMCKNRLRLGNAMLSQEENEILTRVGPGTPCGDFLRRYWHPIMRWVEMLEKKVI